MSTKHELDSIKMIDCISDDNLIKLGQELSNLKAKSLLHKNSALFELYKQVLVEIRHREITYRKISELPSIVHTNCL